MRAPPFSPRVYTAPFGRSLLTAVAEALLAGNLPVSGGPRPGPLELAEVTLLVPTRRDIAALQTAFLAASGGAALLLPRIKLISHESDDLLSAANATDGLSESGQQAISTIERELTLAALVLRWSEAAERGTKRRSAGARTPAQAIRLAKELARLMDMAEIEDVSLMGLESFVPDDHSEHWAKTLEFLQIVTKTWPRHMGELGKVSPAARRKQSMRAEAARLRTAPPAAPVIVAGVTGTVPAATDLMRAVMSLANGAIVLPALDNTLDESSWNSIVPQHPEHPQFGLKKLLDALGLARQDVASLPGTVSSPPQRARWSFVCEAMRPARTTERWHAFMATAATAPFSTAAAGLAILEAPGAEDEAEAVALILREAAEHPNRTAALITPDRRLARRVSTRLRTWDLGVQDAAGSPLRRTELGSFLDLIVDALAHSFRPTPLMALLKHPLCRLGLPETSLERGRRALELIVFRAPYFGQGMEGVVAALDRAGIATERRHNAVRRLQDGDWQAARTVVHRLRGAFAGINKLFAASTKASVHALVRNHIETAEQLASSESVPGTSLWSSETGEKAAELFTSILDPAMPLIPEIHANDYPEFYRGMVADQTILSRGSSHPRLFIWGPLEARLQLPDIVILGGLNEGIWPQAADPGPWFNRPMRQTLGLPAPEERIGQAAHDFASLLGAERVYLSRATKVDGAPTVPSRWLLRLQTLLGGTRASQNVAEPWLAWAQARNTINAPVRPVSAPEPRPAIALRPRQLSVTDVEKWIANPYAIFAARILGLEALPPLGRPPDSAMRGRIVHDALSRFASRFPDQLPADPRGELIALAETVLTEFTGSPRVAAFWAPRFARFAAWFAETEPARRIGIEASLAEVEGKFVLQGAAGPFTLRARADRIDVESGGLIITDYKTGSNMRQLAGRAEAGEAPQLPLEGAIALAGGFARVKPAKIKALRYISASGGEPSGQECEVLPKTGSLLDLVRDARDGLARLVAEFDCATTPYRALRRSRFNYAYDNFAHLARVAEWSLITDEEEV